MYDWKELTETEKLELLERYKIQVLFLAQFACSEDLPATEKKAEDLVRHIDCVIINRTRRKQEAPKLIVANEWWRK